VRRGHTTFRLQLSQDCNEADLIRDIKALDTRLLLFLRRLWRLEISLTEASGSIWSTTIARGGGGADVTKEGLIELHSGGTSARYFVTHFSMRNPEASAQDLGKRASKISLGFPFSDEGSPIITSQLAHAYLPIRDYGFKVRSLLR
jgi:hypothetical protein